MRPLLTYPGLAHFCVLWPGTFQLPVPASLCLRAFCCYCLVWLSSVWLFCNPTDCGPPVSCVQGISQARILEWVSVSFSRGSFQPRDQTFVTKSLFLYWGSLPKPLTPLNVITWPSMTQALVTDVMNGLKYSAVTPGLRADSPFPKIG